MSNSDKKSAGTKRPYTHSEFLKIIEDIARERKLDYFDQLDYILAHEKETTIESDDISFTSVTDFGGSEGIYTDFHVTANGKETHIFTAKTLGDSDEDYIRMHVLAANICLIASKYVREHREQFNWTGYNVSYEKDGSLVPYMWCATEENALNRAKELSLKGYKAHVRNNATRKTV